MLIETSEAITICGSLCGVAVFFARTTLKPLGQKLDMLNSNLEKLDGKLGILEMRVHEEKEARYGVQIKLQEVSDMCIANAKRIDDIERRWAECRK